MSRLDRASLIVERLELVDFRNYAAATFELTAGTHRRRRRQRSGQDQPRRGARLSRHAVELPRRRRPMRWSASERDAAIIRAEVRDDDGRAVVDRGRDADQRARPGAGQPATARSGPATCSGSCGSRCSRPTTSQLVKGGPAERRRFLDDTLVALGVEVRRGPPRARPDAPPAQHAAPPGRRPPDGDGVTTLDVWDAKLVDGRRAVRSGAGRAASSGSRRRWPRPTPQLAGTRTGHRAGYEPAWRATRARRPRSLRPRDDDVRRGVSTVGPHRDELELSIDGHAGAHPRVTGRAAHAGAGVAPRQSTASSPSAPARHRCSFSTTCSPSSTPSAPRALLAHLPAGQIVITTAGALPRGSSPPTAIIRIDAGRIDRCDRVTPMRWRSGDDEPTDAVGRLARRRRALDARRRRRRAGEAQAIGGVFGRWGEIVGDAVAAHVQPVRLDGRRLVVEVADPAWATQIRAARRPRRRRISEVAGTTSRRSRSAVGARRPRSAGATSASRDTRR